MASVVVDDTKLTAIADSIRVKTENPATMTLDQMASTVTNSLSATPIVKTIEAVSEIDGLFFVVLVDIKEAGAAAPAGDGPVALESDVQLPVAINNMSILFPRGISGISEAQWRRIGLHTAYISVVQKLVVTFGPLR